MKIKHQHLDKLPVRNMRRGEVMNLIFQIFGLFFIGLTVLITLEVLLIMADYMRDTGSLTVFKTGQIAVLLILIIDPIAIRPRLGDLFFRKSTGMEGCRDS